MMMIGTAGNVTGSIAPKFKIPILSQKAARRMGHL